MESFESALFFIDQFILKYLKFKPQLKWRELNF